MHLYSRNTSVVADSASTQGLDSEVLAVGGVVVVVLDGPGSVGSNGPARRSPVPGYTACMYLCSRKL